MRSAIQISRPAITAKTAKQKQSHFAHWTAFCESEGRDAGLRTIPKQEDRLCWLLTYGLRYRQTGRTNNSVRSKTVADALVAISQGISDLGYADPRYKEKTTEFHSLYTDFLKNLADEDSPTTRAYPANTTIIRKLIENTDLQHHRDGPLNCLAVDLIIIGFFWLLRPGEYLKGASDGRTTPFKIQDIVFNIDGIHYPALTAPLNDSRSLARIRVASLTFDDQKNAVRGETISHLPTGDDFFCPALALGRIVMRFRAAKLTDGSLPIHRVPQGPTKHVTPAHVTNLLRGAAAELEGQTGIAPYLLSSRSLRPGGATALLIAGIDSDHIQLLGRWKSDAMFRYLRIQAAMHSHRYSKRMLEHGGYSFQPAALQMTGLPVQAPAAMHVALGGTPPTAAEILAHRELYDD